MATYLAVILVNWKQKEDTLRCLHSLERSEYPCHPIVVDNGSFDGSVAEISRHFPKTTLIQLSQNRGFAGACNRGMRWALENTQCEYVFLLNNDAVVYQDALSQLMITAQDYPGAGIFGSKICIKGAPSRVLYAGARRRRLVLAATGTRRGQIDVGAIEKVREVDFVFGGAMLIRRKVIESIGFFDEQYFLYLEDLDFCIRAQEAGYSLLYVPSALVLHDGPPSTENFDVSRRHHFIRSSIRYLRKHGSVNTAVPLFVFWSLVFLRQLFRDLYQGGSIALIPYWSGLRSGFAK